MRSVALCVVVFLGCSAATHRPLAPGQIDSRLHSVVTEGSARLLVYRVCSPEHCWSVPYLQWLAEFDDSILETTQVSELSYGTILEGIAPSYDSQDRPFFAFRVSASHGGFEPYAATLVPGTPGSYTLTP